MQLNLNDSGQSAFDNEPSPWFKIFLGLMQTLALHCLQLIPLLLAVISGYRAFRLIFLLFGVTQLVYMIPAIIYYQNSGESERRMGLIIGTSLTLLLGIPFFLFALSFAPDL